MSLVWLDAKYVSLVSFRLRNFKRKGQHQWNFSCPVCGDSKTNKSKARGYIYPVKGKLLFHCHNCNVTMDVPRFVKTLDQSMYDDYIKEKLVANPNDREESDLTKFVKKMEVPKFQADTPLKKLKKISALKPENPAKLYIQNRLIPAEYHYKLFLCLGFKKWVNEILPGKFESEDNDEPRLIIPFLDKDKNLFGFQGRSFKRNTKLRYVTIMLNRDHARIYGLDNVDPKLHMYVVEGPIDSMFIPNCVASAGGDIIADLKSITEDPSNFTVVYDNEPRNVETIKKIEKAAAAGYNICLWPESVKEKDINDMVLNGYTSERIVDIIRNNTYKGLEAKLGLSMWKRC
jgi:hypothetical protein